MDVSYSQKLTKKATLITRAAAKGKEENLFSSPKDKLTRIISSVFSKTPEFIRRVPQNI